MPDFLWVSKVKQLVRDLHWLLWGSLVTFYRPVKGPFCVTIKTYKQLVILAWRVPFAIFSLSLAIPFKKCVPFVVGSNSKWNLHTSRLYVYRFRHLLGSHGLLLPSCWCRVGALKRGCFFINRLVRYVSCRHHWPKFDHPKNLWDFRPLSTFLYAFP